MRQLLDEDIHSGDDEPLQSPNPGLGALLEPKGAERGQDQAHYNANATPQQQQKRRERLVQLQQKLRSRAATMALARLGEGKRSMQSAAAPLCGDVHRYG